MKHVELLNRGQLETELENQGILDLADQLIERMKEHVRYMSKHVFEQVVIDAKMVVNNAVKTIIARFAVYDYEDASEDGGTDPIKYVEFESLSPLKEV
ncbi:MULTISPECIES: hypothetical protein [Bacillaceae]|uniref:Phage gp6-like head-tail connector protein n=2 Tax=Bacillaceae TaxID=186817 RepID=A0A9D5DPX4_9BACI|nr:MULTISPECIES: hypothetical protein [Bacillaceae]KQL56968.1 hypothetical protein AN965_10925 [Alkalicoccobacillus plakortidis]WDF05524.1 hypothetical protein PQ477_08825 [Shouchella hunanensis]